MAPISDKLKAVVDELFELPQEDQDEFAERINALKLAKLREEIRHGLESPDEDELDVESIKREARQEWEARRTA